MHATSEEECAGARIIKLAAVIAPDILDSGAKLGRHVGKEISQSSVGVRLEA